MLHQNSCELNWRIYENKNQTLLPTWKYNMDSLWMNMKYLYNTDTNIREPDTKNTVKINL